MSDTTFIPAAPARPRPWIGRLLASARLMLERSRERRLLLEMDERTLRDLGISRYEAGMEARKPFWHA